MTATVSVEDAAKRLREMLGKRKVEPISAMPEGYLEDYAKIFSLMTDKERCLAHLGKLNTVLVTRADNAHIRKKNVFGRGTRQLKSEEVTYTADNEERSTYKGTFKKHGNILRDYLDQWEATQGFNAEGQIEGGIELPGKAPLLTGFVQPDNFRKYLLKHGFHWTDIGVAANHGEFTHRLHWYIICGENESN